MTKNVLKTFFILGIIVLNSKINAQWSGSNPITTTSNVNIGGLQEARFHILSTTGLIVSPPSDPYALNPNPYKQMLYLTKELNSSIFRPGSSSTVIAKPSWGFDIDDKTKKLSISFIDLLNQPLLTTVTIPGTTLQMSKYIWSKPVEVFSINTSEVVSNVNFKSKSVTTDDLTINNDFVLKSQLIVRNKTTNDIELKIYNDGWLTCRHVSVNYLPIADYVFSKNYNLMPIEQLESFIKKEKHLPNIKSDVEYQEEGKVDLGEMNVKLLEKVEELTLYLIDQNKKIKELELEVLKMKK